MASGANYLLVSGLKPKGKIGKRLMVQREHLQERYRKREVLVRERMGVGRERMRARQVGGKICSYVTTLSLAVRTVWITCQCTSDSCAVFRSKSVRETGLFEARLPFLVPHLYMRLNPNIIPIVLSTQRKCCPIDKR